MKETLSQLAYSVWAQHPWLVCMCLSVSLSISIRKIPMFGLEAIFRNGVPVGHLRRSDYGFFIDKTIGYGYIRSPDGGVVKTLDTQHLHIYSHTVSLSVMSLILSYLCFVSWAVVIWSHILPNFFKKIFLQWGEIPLVYNCSVYWLAMCNKILTRRLKKDRLLH